MRCFLLSTASFFCERTEDVLKKKNFSQTFKKRGALISVAAAAVFMCGCGSVGEGDDGAAAADTQTKTADAAAPTEGVDISLKGEYSGAALDGSYSEDGAAVIKSNKKSVKVKGGRGVKVKNNIVSITRKGVYVVRGKIRETQIAVDVSDDEDVRLVLDGADISYSKGPAIWVKNAKNIYLTLADGSANKISDGSDYKDVGGDVNLNAALFSQDDLIINGGGSLLVNGNYKDGITCRDDLTIVEGSIEVDAKDDAIVGKDGAAFKNPKITLSCGGDGIKSSLEGDLSKGYIIIDGGSFEINAGDDGMHSETAIVINGGSIDIKNSVEGIESLNVGVNAGKVLIVSSDDGINISGAGEKSGKDAPGMGGMDAPIDGALVINGGDVDIDANGDGIDSNGGILMTGGSVKVAGPTDDGNGAFDFNSAFEMDGGEMLAYGSSGMAQVPSESSKRSFLAATVDEYSEGSRLEISRGGEVLASAVLKKSGNFIFYSSEDIKDGEEYEINIDGKSKKAAAGEAPDGGFDAHKDMGGREGMGGMHGGRPDGIRERNGRDGAAPSDKP